MIGELFPSHPSPHPPIFRKNILHFTSENVLFEMKQWCLPS